MTLVVNKQDPTPALVVNKQDLTLIRIAAVAAGLLVTPFAAEGLFRLIDPTPRVQAIRDPFVLMDGVPVWNAQHGDRRNLDCATEHPDRHRIVFFGSSILFGSDVEHDEVFSSLIQDRRDDLCLINLAQPAFAFEQKLALARKHVADLKPDLVFWEVWATDIEHFTVIGDVAYNFGTLDVDPDQGWLFRNSRVYEHFVISRAPARTRTGDPWAEHARDTMPDILPFDPVLVFAPVLDRPFARSVAEPTDFARKIMPWASDNGVGTMRLALALLDQEVREMRLDPCCHYSVAGHRALARVFEREIDTRLTATN